MPKYDVQQAYSGYQTPDKIGRRKQIIADGFVKLASETDQMGGIENLEIAVCGYQAALRVNPGNREIRDILIGALENLRVQYAAYAVSPECPDAERNIVRHALANINEQIGKAKRPYIVDNQVNYFFTEGKRHEAEGKDQIAGMLYLRAHRKDPDNREILSKLLKILNKQGVFPAEKFAEQVRVC